MRGDGRVFRRGQVWWIAYYRNSRECRESSKSRQRKDAVRLLRQRIGEVAEDNVHVHMLRQKRSIKMSDLFDLAEHHYELNDRMNRTNASHLRRLRRQFSGYAVHACTGLVISHYMAARRRAGRAPETINREMAVLRVAFKVGYEHDFVARMPVIKRLPELSVRNEFFTRAEIDSLLPRLPESMRDVVLFGYLTGWRKGEIVELRWNNVDRGGAVIRLEPGQNKARDVRVLAVHGELAAVIERRWRARRSERTLTFHVFPDKSRQRGGFRNAWLKACREAGLGHRLFHSLRRTAARNMSLQGIPEKVIMSIMGHKTRTMLDRYNIVTEADQRVYMERLYGP